MTQKDIFRDTWVRYLGYTNEVGESFRPIIPVRVVHCSYAVAFGYVLADTAHKGLSKWREGHSQRVYWATGDAFLWQTFASIIIPGYTINRIVFGSNFALKKLLPKVPSKTRTWMTVGIGLASIPVIVSPIDHFVHLLMDCTYRQLFK